MIELSHKYHKKGEKMRDFFKRIQSQKGLSGVLVALLLVVVGVGLVAGVNTYLTNAKTEILDASDTSLNAGC